MNQISLPPVGYSHNPNVPEPNIEAMVLEPPVDTNTEIEPTPLNPECSEDLCDKETEESIATIIGFICSIGLDEEYETAYFNRCKQRAIDTRFAISINNVLIKFSGDSFQLTPEKALILCGLIFLAGVVPERLKIHKKMKAKEEAKKEFKPSATKEELEEDKLLVEQMNAVKEPKIEKIETVEIVEESGDDDDGRKEKIESS